MGSKKEYIGRLLVKFGDKTTLAVTIHKSGRTIFINDKPVHASNRDSFDGVIHEIEVFCNMPVKDYEWLEQIRELKFRKYKN